MSLEEEERRQSCFVGLNNAKVATREVNANISISIFSTRFEKKLSMISECTKSLANDRDFDTNSINSGNEVIHDDVMSMEKAFKINKQKGDQFIIEERTIAKASVCIFEVVEVVQQIESIVPVIQMETTQFGKNCRSKTIDRIKDWQIETTDEFREVEDEKPLSHVFEENHVELLSKVQETSASNYHPSLIGINFLVKATLDNQHWNIVKTNWEVNYNDNPMFCFFILLIEFCFSNWFILVSSFVQF